jgi:hypothetical protein
MNVENIFIYGQGTRLMLEMLKSKEDGDKQWIKGRKTLEGLWPGAMKNGIAFIERKTLLPRREKENCKSVCGSRNIYRL